MNRIAMVIGVALALTGCAASSNTPGGFESTTRTFVTLPSTDTS